MVYHITAGNGDRVATSHNLFQAHRMANVMRSQTGNVYNVVDSDTGEISTPESLIDVVSGSPKPLNRSEAKKHVPREDSIVASILKFLNGLNKCKAEKRQGTVTQRDRPDIIGCIQGLFFAFEVKRGDEEASDSQLNQLKRWVEAGGIAAVVYSVDDVKEVFNHFGIKWNE